MSETSIYLLLADAARDGAEPAAHCVRIERFELMPSGRALDGQFRVGKCRKTEELALVESADRGGGLAYAALARERLLPTSDVLEDPAKALRAPPSSLQPGLRLNFHVPAQGRALDGNSADLLFALATLCAALRLDSRAPLAATGALDADGFVLGVAHVGAKLAAAVNKLGDDAVVFYPRENDGPDIQALRDELADQGRGALRLVALDRLEDAAPVLGLPIAADWRESPWRGLDQYQLKHRAIFFGREAEEAELCGRLIERERAGVPGALVLANSGAGKSSFLHAAIVPRIELELRDARAVRWCLWRPGSRGGRSEDALVATVLACWREAIPAAVTADAEPPTSFAQLRERIDGAALQRVRFLWLIDPFEDIFAADFDATVVTALCQFIRDVQRDFGVWVLGGLQSRYLGRIQEQPALIEAFGDLGGGDGNAGMFLLHKLSPTALREMIEGPARLARITFEPDGRGGTLADAIQRDMEGETDALPLMSMALARLHAAAVAAKRTELLFADYRAGTDAGSSGLKNAIAERASEVFDSAELNDSARRRLARLLRALVRHPKADDEEIAPRSLALSDDWRPGTPGRRLIDVFVERRLLIREEVGGDTVGGERVRVVHKALLTHWPKAAEILRDNREIMLTRERLDASANEWDRATRNADALLTSPKDIADARQLRRRLAADLARSSSLVLREFIDASVRAADQREEREQQRIQQELERERSAKKRLLLWAWSAGIAAVLAAAAAGFAGTQWRDAATQRSEAQKTYALALSNARETMEIVKSRMPAGRLVTLTPASHDEFGISAEVAKALLESTRKAFAALPTHRDTDLSLVNRFELFVTLAESLSKGGHYVAALEAAEEVLRLGDDDRVKASLGSRRLLYVTRARLLKGFFLAGLDRPEPELAKHEYQAVIDISLSQATVDKDTFEWTKRLVEAYDALGDAHRLLFEFDVALVFYKESAKRVSLLLHDKANILGETDKLPLLRKEAILNGKIGDVYAAKGEFLLAKTYHGSNLEISISLTMKNRKNDDFSRGRAIALERLGYVLRKLKDLHSAEETYQEAIKINRELLLKDDGNIDWTFNLAYSHLGLADVLRDTGELKGAEDNYLLFLGTLESLRARGIRHQRLGRDILTGYQRLAYLHRSGNRLASSMEYLRKCTNDPPMQVFFNPRNSEPDDPRSSCAELLAQSGRRAG